MKHAAVGMCAMGLWLAAALHAEVLIPPNDPNINYYGRFDFSNAAATVPFNWPGSIIEASFPGPSIGVELNDGGGSYFNVEIDGVLVDSLSPTTTTHRTIRTDLSTGNHTIRITLRSNGLNCSFGGFYLADGKSLAAKPARPIRKMEFIGDSWTAGDVIGQTALPIDLKYFNAPLTFARRTSLAFHAQDMLIARGGCGLVTSNSNAPTMPTRYPELLCDGTAKWDFTSWIPDVVVIFLGINDFNNSVTDAAFKAAYAPLINTVRGHYPNVPIILMGLPGNILNDVQTVAQSFTGVTVFSSPITLANAQALYQHPNAAQHQLISDSLIPVVARATGWDTTASVGIHVPQARWDAGRNGEAIFEIASDRVDFPPLFSGSVKQASVYDFSGRLIRKRFAPGQAISLSGDFGLPAGMYFIKTEGLDKSPQP